jgi:hypothetical protein
MATRYETVYDLFSKVEWEGGLFETINSYGVSSDELPLGTPTDIIEAWDRIEATGPDAASIWRWMIENGDED